MKTLSQKISEFSREQYTKWDKLPLSQKTRILGVTIIIGFANLLYSLFSVYTIVSTGIILGAALLITKSRVEAIMNRGLLAFLPKGSQQTLLERSIFDILCDLWFVPRLGLYVQAFLKPFLVKISPEDAIHQLEDLPESSQKTILQKVDALCLCCFSNLEQ